MDTLIGALIGFLSAVLTALLGFLLYRRDKYKEFVYQRKILFYEEVCGQLARIVDISIKLRAVTIKKDAKSLQESSEYSEFISAVLSLYVLCYEKNLFISERLFLRVVKLLEVCFSYEIFKEPDFFKVFLNNVKEIINIMREDVGVEKLSDEIKREIEKFL